MYTAFEFGRIIVGDYCGSAGIDDKKIACTFKDMQIKTDSASMSFACVFIRQNYARDFGYRASIRSI